MLSIVESSFWSLSSIFFGVASKFSSMFGSNYFSQTSINIASFKKLFISKTDTKNVIGKRIFLHGHGLDGQLVAGMKLAQYKEFLSFLPDINTEFLIISSCFVSGANLLEMQKWLTEQNAKAFPDGIDFSIVLMGTTDSIVTGTEHDYKRFFGLLDIWLRERRLYLSKVIVQKGRPQPVSLKDVLQPLFIGNVDLVNYPSVRFPGTRTFFRVVEVENMFILTYTALQGLLLDHELLYNALTRVSRERGIPIPPKLDGPFINLFSKTRSVFVYPSIISDVIIRVMGANTPIFISKIIGKAQHFIGKMESIDLMRNKKCSQAYLPLSPIITLHAR